MRRAMAVLGVVLLSACGGGSRGDDDDDDDTGGSAPRLWDRQAVLEAAGAPGLSVASDGTVDIVTTGRVGEDFGIVWTQLGGVPELAAVTSDVESGPAVARDASGAVHVVWGTTMPAAVWYAVRRNATWTVETVATDRFRPDVAVTADGTPHVVFADEETGNATAYHAVRGAGGWDIETVNATDWFADPEVRIVVTDDGQMLVASVNTDRMGAWLATADGAGGWTVEDLAADRYATGRLDLAAGAAGTAIAFKDGSQTVVAWRAAGDDAWSIEDASHHDSDGEPISVVVAAGGPMVVSDVDVQYPNGVALLERTGGGWSGQLLATYSCSTPAAAIDPRGQPALVLNCEGGLYYWTIAGAYPADWSARCEAATADLCAQACTCGVDGEDCCWGLGGNSTCTSAYGCPINGVAVLCGDPTVSPEALQQCRDELGTLTCGETGPLELTGSCAHLYLPFQQ